ncbi:hypothetical protein [Alteromonas sp. 14N.309.X.WAT.G.H12]|uniref:hypothetical protein n=1 Tax=Alteromonas sp. 14N.309.X.WAT.G.H12 TaxID=3120824 RepID=UPI002FD63D07
MAHNLIATAYRVQQGKRLLLYVKRCLFRLFLRGGRWGAAHWRTFNFAQRCYVAATLIAFGVIFFDISSDFIQMCMFLLVLSGLLHEFWPRFMVAWNSLLGRAGVLFCYAVMANFALASASGLVNTVTGITAESLPYSHNFAIILMLPSWFFISTVFVLLCSQLLMPIYLIILLLLKPFGVNELWHPPDYKYVFTTAFLRYVWTLALLIKIVAVAAQSGVLEFSDSSELGQALSQIAEQAENEVSAAPSQSTKIAPHYNGLKVDSDDEAIMAFVLKAKQNGAAFRLAQKKLLADFIFEYEADSYSRCQHPPNSKVIEINDYEILTITQDDALPLQYAYDVIACHSAAIGNTVAQP